MKNVALFIAAFIFTIAAVAQLLRYYLKIAVVIGSNHIIPVEVSFYASIILGIVALWMLVAGLIKHKD